MELANAVEDESEIPDDAAESSQTDQQDTTRKRKKKKVKARVQGELDFWSCLEEWWKARIEEWGNNLGDSEMWQRFVVGSPPPNDAGKLIAR